MVKCSVCLRGLLGGGGTYRLCFRGLGWGGGGGGQLQTLNGEVLCVFEGFVGTDCEW